MTLYDALRGALSPSTAATRERTLNLVMPGLDGLQQMADLMTGLRASPPPEHRRRSGCHAAEGLPGRHVWWTRATGAASAMELSGSNVLRYELCDGTSLIVRPSGTEPKVKVYILAQGTDRADCAAKVAQYAAWAESPETLTASVMSGFSVGKAGAFSL